MGAFADLSALKAAIEGPREIKPMWRTPSSGRSGRWTSTWALAGEDGTPSSPTTAAAPDRTTLGALGQQNASSEQLIAVGFDLHPIATSATSPVAEQTFLLCDRLSHQGGLAGNINTLQTTNLPTAALSRYTSGAGVMMAIEVSSGGLGGTNTTLTVTYTNTSSVGSRTTSVAIGNTDGNTGYLVKPIPLGLGDTGVLSIESCQLAASTGQPGPFGLILFKPLAMVSTTVPLECPSTHNLIDGRWIGGLPEIVDDACLFWMHMPSYGFANCSAFGAARFAAV